MQSKNPSGYPRTERSTIWFEKYSFPGKSYPAFKTHQKPFRNNRHFLCFRHSIMVVYAAYANLLMFRVAKKKLI